MDLDDFKKVNDTYGHSAGDNYLKRFTRTTIKTIDNKGSIYRISGDEFVFLYKDNKIDLLLTTFNENIINSFEMGIPFFGVSIGYAKFPQDANTLEELLIKANSAMYKEKKQAKNYSEPLK